MRVLLCLHHRLVPDLGAPGVTLALGRALERAGCEVEFLDFGQVFSRRGQERAVEQVAFPWRVARALRRRAARLDVVDASTGDAWLWAALGRPGGGERPALITRSHGIEPLAHEQRLSARRRGELRLSRRYPLYHGGWRLWEVRRSLRLADGCVLLNRIESEYVTGRLGVAADRVSVIRYAIADHFQAAAPPEPVGDGPLRVAFVGSWIERKGTATIAAALALTERRAVPVRLTVLGAGEAEVVPQAAQVVPGYANERLPELLAGQEVLLLPSQFEGSSGSLLEGMACGLAPIATSVGAAPEIVEPHRNGVLVEVGDAEGVADALEALASDRPALLEMRRHAQRTARAYRWDRVAELTLEAYERALATRSTASTKRGPTRSQT